MIKLSRLAIRILQALSIVSGLYVSYLLYIGEEGEAIRTIISLIPFIFAIWGASLLNNIMRD